MAKSERTGVQTSTGAEMPAVLLRPAAEAVTPHVKRLLKRMDVLPIEGRRIAWPGDGTLLAAWRHCEDAIIREPTADEFERYRLVKSRLKARSLPPSNAAILMLQRFAGDRPITAGFGQALLGSSCRASHIAAAGLSVQGRVGSAKPGVATTADLLALLPEPCRERLLAQLDREVLPPVVPPSRAFAGRVLALRGQASRVMAAVGLLMLSATRRSRSLSVLCLHIAERFDGLVPADLQTHGEVVTAALDNCAADDPSKATARCLYHYDGQLSRIIRFLDEVLGEDAGVVVALLPARHNEHRAFRKRMWNLCYETIQLRRGVKRRRIAGMFDSLDAIMVACDNRVAQLEAIFLTVAASRSEAVTATSRLVECVVPVVRSDGSLAPGRQIVRFEIGRDHDLVRDARASAPRDERSASLDYRRNMNTKAAVEAAAREHLVYVDTRPLIEGGECVEPFFVRLYRSGIFDDGAGLPSDRAEERAQLLSDAGLPLHTACAAGFLRHDLAQLSVVRALRRSKAAGAPVIVPLTALVHAMSIAHVVIRMGVRWGMRIGATRQLRMGCLSTEMLDGRMRCVAELRLKGSVVPQRCEIDLDTVERIRRIMKLAHARWFSHVFDGTRPALPVVPLRETGRADIPDGRYILVGPTGSLRSQDLSIFIRVLLIGVANATSHDCRYLFATALGFDGVSRRDIGAGLFHRAGSATTAMYDVSEEVRRRRMVSGGPPRSDPIAGEQP